LGVRPPNIGPNQGRRLEHHSGTESGIESGDSIDTADEDESHMSGESKPLGSLFDALETAGETDVGQVRMANQDAFGEFRDDAKRRHLLLVADGMGGHRGGEVASRMTVDAVGECFDGEQGPPGEFVLTALTKANTRVNDRAATDGRLQGMGTTAVALLFDGTPEAWVAHVGDSRCYRLRDGVMTQITEDHSVVGELVRRGQLTAEEARVHPQSNEILRAIGTQSKVMVEVAPVELRPGDRYLLCSDGLSGMVTDDEIAEVLGSQSAADAVRTLIERANLAGGTDNITVQIGIIGDYEGVRDQSGAPASPDQTQRNEAPREPTKLDLGALPWLIVAAAIAMIAAWWISS